MTINHKDILNPDRHNPKDFEGAGVSTVLSKDSNGNLEWVPKNDIGGSEGPQGEIGPPGTTDHTQLLNLNADDHLQYFRTDGTRILTGDLDVGGNNLQSVGNINSIPAALATPSSDGFTSSADKTKLDGIPGDTQLQINNTNSLLNSHATRHLPSGADPFATAAPISQTPDQANAEGSADSFARSDHQHSIPTENAISLLPDGGNTEGSSTSFSRSDHTHDIPAAVSLDLPPEAGNQEGSANSFSRSDHVHNVPTATPATLGPDNANTEGTAASFSRSDHVHNVPTATPITLGPDNANAEGSATSFSRSDHVHNVPAGAPIGSLGANSSNTEGAASEFSRSDHIHEVVTGVPVTLSPDQTNSEGTSNDIARADHIHNVPAAVSVDVSDQNLEGASTSFSRADHEHNVFPVFQQQDVEDEVFQSTTGTAFVNAINLTTPSLPTGRYKIEWFYVWSHNSTGNDFEGRVQLNNVDNLLPSHRQEPQDSGGPGAGGTDQRYNNFGFAFRNFSGINSIDFDFRSSTAGILASIHIVRVAITRVS